MPTLVRIAGAMSVFLTFDVDLFSPTSPLVRALEEGCCFFISVTSLAADAPVPEKIDAMDAMQWTDDARDKEELRLRLFLAFQFF